MAYFGAKYPCFLPDGEMDGVVLGKLVGANLTVNLASGEIYADDSLSEQTSEFVSGALTLETDDMTDDVASAVFGAAAENGTVVYRAADTAPFGALCYYKTVMRDGIKLRKAYCYPRVKAALGSDNAQTKGSSISISDDRNTACDLCRRGDGRLEGDCHD
jgi:uncharacterized glyoxalase superfamily protein PhnB